MLENKSQNMAQADTKTHNQLSDGTFVKSAKYSSLKEGSSSKVLKNISTRTNLIPDFLRLNPQTLSCQTDFHNSPENNPLLSLLG